MAFAASVVALTLVPTGAGAVSDGVAIGHLNVQRKTHKIPARISVIPSLSDGCAKHNNYMNQNDVLTHFENPGDPGFTPEGRQAGLTSVLARGAAPWSSPRANPWEAGPIHLSQLLAPDLLVSGYNESFGFSCATTLAAPRRTNTKKIRVFTYPGPGSRLFYRGERAAEGPYTPGELIGIPQRTLTGPYILVLLDGPNRSAIDAAKIRKAILRKSTGRKVGVRKIGSAHAKLTPFMPPGGFVIPKKPLKAGALYRITVVIRAGGRTLRHKWNFRVGRVIL